jgi:aminoglycoside 6'-N-acetyltransferase
MHLRPATPADVALLRRWDNEPHVAAALSNGDWGWEHELTRSPDWREQLIAEVDGRPVGFIQISDPALEDSHYWGECPEHLRAIDLWIGAARDLGRGYGTAMIKLAIERCFAPVDVEAIVIDPLHSNERVRRFYERLGFKYVERRMFGEDDCAVYRLQRSGWNC